MLFPVSEEQGVLGAPSAIDIDGVGSAGGLAVLSGGGEHVLLRLVSLAGFALAAPALPPVAAAGGSFAAPALEGKAQQAKFFAAAHVPMPRPEGLPKENVCHRFTPMDKAPA